MLLPLLFLVVRLKFLKLFLALLVQLLEVHFDLGVPVASFDLKAVFELLLFKLFALSFTESFVCDEFGGRGTMI